MIISQLELGLTVIKQAANEVIQLVFQLKEEMKFRYNYPLVRLCLTKRITNQQIAYAVTV